MRREGNTFEIMLRSDELHRVHEALVANQVPTTNAEITQCRRRR